MARYIEETEIYKLVEPHGTAKVHCSQIDELPRADVVPKSEVEADFEKRLAQYQDKEKCIYTYDGEIFDYCVQGPCPHHKVLEDVRKEVASEIFAEIYERLLLSFPAQSFIDAPCTTHDRLFNMVAELKKKYTEVEERN